MYDSIETTLQNNQTNAIRSLATFSSFETQNKY